MATLQGTIMPKARIQNIPLNCPTSIDLLSINFATKRINTKPINMKTNAFDLFMKISLLTISNLDVLIKNNEKSIPTSNASRISGPVTRKNGNMNISAPVLIKIGGKMIFLLLTGFLDAFMRTTITETAIKIATTVDIYIKMIHTPIIAKQNIRL